MQEDDFKQQWKTMPDVPFSIELKKKILKQAAELNEVQQKLSRKRTARSRIGSMVGTLGAAVIFVATVVGAWRYGNVIRVPSLSLPSSHTTANSAAENVYGVSVAPISVGIQFVKDGIVTASLTNVGTKTIQQDEIVGILSFQDGNSPDVLSGSHWVTFVDAPHMNIAPGDTVTWTFRPIGVPQDAVGGFLGRPRLLFVYRGLADPSKADVLWQKVPAVQQNLRVGLRKQWASGESFGVNFELKNTSTMDVPLQQALAIVWISPPGVSQSDWTNKGAIRFMSGLGTTVKTLHPGDTVPVSIHLIGPPNVAVSPGNVHVILIWR